MADCPDATDDSEGIQYMDIKEFQELGFLQEANRRFFHPLGLALEIRIAEDGTYYLGGVWDYREDPEGMLYGAIDVTKFDNVQDELARHIAARKALLDGEIVQPLGHVYNP